MASSSCALVSPASARFLRPSRTADRSAGKAAPFKRNDQLLKTLPIGLIVFPGSGITDNLADKAKVLGIPLYDFRKAQGGSS